MSETRPGELSLFFHRVSALVKRPTVTCARGVSAVEVARRLSREGVGSIVIVDDDGAPLGIVTDRDLRRKLVAEARDAATTPAAAIMSSPLVTLPPAAFAFEALLEMTRHRIRHVVLLEAGRAVGVVSSRDFLLLQTTHPVTLAREIVRAPSIEALAVLATRVLDLVRRLVAERGTAYDIGKIVAELDDRMVARVLGLTRAALEAEGMNQPPLAYCWLALGRDARREQTVRTDHHGGILFEEGSPDVAAAATAYFSRLGAATVQALVRIGFPYPPDQPTVSIARRCRSLSAWRSAFRDWMCASRPEEVRAASIHFDLRPVAGEPALAEALRDLVRQEAPDRHAFLRALAQDVVGQRLPLTILGNVAVLRDGPRRGTVDVEDAGACQLVGAARLHALALGLAETNTIDRLKAAASRGALSGAEVAEAVEAYQHLLRLRLVHQLAQVAQGEPPDSYIRPGQLARADAVLLRDAMRVVADVQRSIRRRIAADLAR